MARIRSVHPGVWTDEGFVSVSPYARLLAIGLWNECDDQGAFMWKPVTLKMRLLPADNVDMTALLAELTGANIVRQYEVDGRQFGAVRNFALFQRPKKPKNTHPMPGEFRTYAGHGAESSEPDDGETPQGAPPPPSEPSPVPHQFPTSSPPVPPMEEIAAQREEIRGKEESKKDSEATPLTPEPSPSPPSAKAMIWTHGLPMLVHMTGKSDAQCRGLLGKMLKHLQDDCPKMLLILQQAHAAQPVDPVAWITAAVRGRGGKGAMSSDERLLEAVGLWSPNKHDDTPARPHPSSQGLLQ